MPYSVEVRQKARDLFGEAETTYEALARKIGVSVSGLKQWGIRGKWTEQREKYRRDRESLRDKALTVRISALNALMKMYETPGKFRAQDACAHLEVIRLMDSLGRDRRERRGRAITEGG